MVKLNEEKQIKAQIWDTGRYNIIKLDKNNIVQ
jgi:hypothetical protein